MLDIRYYISIALRRAPWFLAVAGLIAGFGIAVAITLPPAYVSSTRLLVESSQIPGNLAASTVNMSGAERLQVFQTQLLTRNNLLDIARKLNAIPNQQDMSPDEIVGAMRSRTTIRNSAGRDRATLMTMSFESQNPRTAAAVLNEYLSIVLNLDTEYRTGRATQTQEFFQQEVQRLNEELELQSAKILSFKSEHADALPDAQAFRRDRLTGLQERLRQIERNMADLQERRDRLQEVYQATGRIEGAPGERRSADEQALSKAKRDLRDALLIYSDSNPRVTLLKARISQLEEIVAEEMRDGANDVTGAGGEPVDPTQAMFDLQMTEIDSDLQTLDQRRIEIEAEMAQIDDAISRTASNAIALEALERDYRNIQDQYNQATDRLATASTGERIELLSRGQRITVVEQPSVPTEPTKPNRTKMAVAAIGAGVAAGAALVALLELLNSTARRPTDLVNGLGIAPLATVPYLRTRREAFRRRAGMIMAVLIVAAAIPVAIYAVHTYYQPLDLIADRIMNKLGVRG